MSVFSMTGFASVEGSVAGTRMCLEIKALNHRFLDVKVRLPRQLSSAEVPLRAALQSRFSRGSLDVKLDRQSATEKDESPFEPNLSLAAQYYECLVTLQRTLGLADSIRTLDVASFPDVISRNASEYDTQQAWGELEPLVRQAMDKLAEMRAHEGDSLVRVLRDALKELETTIQFLRKRRDDCASAYRTKLREKIEAIFKAYPLAETQVQAVLETRVAQELAVVLDRTDIEEELVRFQGHLDHFRKVLDAGGPVGRKLDFILQELSREINTLGNKAQDLAIGQEVVQVKVRLEQLREQVMNLE